MPEIIVNISIQRDIQREIRSQKFVSIRSDEFSIPADLVKSQQQFHAEWGNLEPDDYLGEGARFRYRRFGLFSYIPSSDQLISVQTPGYFQSSKINSYAGGVVRSFAPLSETAVNNDYLQSLIRFDYYQLPAELTSISHAWTVDVHQVRILATDEWNGLPTPEGIHRDGEEFVCIHLVNCQNIEGGVSAVYTNNGRRIYDWAMREPMDSMLLWDLQVMHAVSPVKPKRSGIRAVRDVLLIGFDPSPEIQTKDRR